MLINRHHQDGGPLNFRQRAERVLELLRGDLELCWLKSRILEYGLKFVSDHPLPLPPIDGPLRYATSNGAHFLDDWVLWARKVGELIQAESEQESEIEYVISLGTKTPGPHATLQIGPFPLTETPLRLTVVLVPTIAERLRNGLALTFSLGGVTNTGRRYSVLPDIVAKPRLIGLSLSCSFVDPANPVSQRCRFSAVITNSQTNAPCFISGIPAFPDRAPWAISPRLFNLDPSEGTWTVRLEPKLQMQELESSDFSVNSDRWGLVDLLLHLRLTCRLAGRL